jgi:hypothetical protein
MTAPSYSISFSVVLSGSAGTGSAGDVLIKNASDGLYVKATTANRGTRRSTGIALRSYVANGVVDIQQDGEVSAAVSGLGAGLAGHVRTSTTGTLERVVTPGASDDVIGWCETDGTLHLRFGQIPGGYGSGGSAAVADDIGKSGPTDIDRVLGLKGVQFEVADTLGVGEVWKKVGASLRAGKPVMPDYYNVLDYGLVADGVTYNDAALATLIDTTIGDPTTFSGESVTVYFPKGQYAFADDIHINRPIHLVGPGHRAVEFYMDPGKGIIIHDTRTCPLEGGSGRLSIIDNIFVRCQDPTYTVWAELTPHVAGDFILAPDRNRNYYECIVAGTTAAGASEPDWTSGYLPCATVDRPVSSRARLNLVVHDLSQSTTVFWECTTAGTTGPDPLVFDTTPGNTTNDGSAVWTCRTADGSWITDGTVVWATRVAAGIRLEAKASVKNCEIFHSLNAGIHVQAGPNVPVTNANHFTIQKCNILYCGVGVAIRGGDAERGVLEHVACQGIGFYVPGTGGVGIWDGGFLGCCMISCEVEVCTGRTYIVGLYEDDPAASNGTAGSMFYCTSETGYGEALFAIGASAIGCIFGSGVASTSNWTGLSNEGGHNIREIDTASADLITGYLNIGNNMVLAYGSNNEVPYLGRSFEATDLGRTGWWSDSYNFGVRAGFSWSGGTATEGAGWNWQPMGVFQGGRAGVFTGQYFRGLDPESMRSQRVRTTGEYEIGDRFDLQSDGVAGGHTGYIVTVAGMRGLAGWIALRAVDGADIWEPSDQWDTVPPPAGGKVFQPQGAGTTDASEPDWSTATIVGHTVIDNDVTWELIGFVPEYNKLGAIDLLAAPIVTTSDSPVIYVTLATLAVGDVKRISVLATVAKSDAATRQSFRLEGLFYGAAGPTATLDGGSLTDASPYGTGAAIVELDLSAALVRLKITGVAATTLTTTYEVHIL